MKNIVIITSVINISKDPLFYSNVRSVFNSQERLEQTLKTIESIRKYIDNSEILLIEGSHLTEEQKKILDVNYFLDLYQDTKLNNDILSNKNKAIGEIIQTVKAIDFIIDNNIQFDNLFKISGRYWINENFSQLSFDNDLIISKCISSSNVIRNTVLYKIPKKITLDYYNFLKQKLHNGIKKNDGFEVIFTEFVIKFENNILKIIGVNGYLAPDGRFVDL